MSTLKIVHEVHPFSLHNAFLHQQKA